MIWWGGDWSEQANKRTTSYNAMEPKMYRMRPYRQRGTRHSLCTHTHKHWNSLYGKRNRDPMTHPIYPFMKHGARSVHVFTNIFITHPIAIKCTRARWHSYTDTHAHTQNRFTYNDKCTPHNPNNDVTMLTWKVSYTIINNINAKIKLF